jgi:hypothetical protein
MKILTFSHHFPKGHPKASQPTWFVESILNAILRTPDDKLNLDDIMPAARDYVNDFQLIANERQKHTTIRAGSRWKAGDMASLRIWSGAPYRSKQIEFAQVEIKRVWDIEIWTRGVGVSIGLPEIRGIQMRLLPLCEVAANDGLDCRDFEDWFNVHPKNKRQVFTGQIIAWSDKIDYTPSIINS